MKPEHEEDHRQEAIRQYDNFVMSDKPLSKETGHKSKNLGHGNECSECNNAVVADMEKDRNDHFKDGLSE